MISGKLTCVVVILVALTINYIECQRHRSPSRQTKNLTKNAPPKAGHRAMYGGIHVGQALTGSSSGRRTLPQSLGRNNRQQTRDFGIIMRKKKKHGKSSNPADFECGLHFEPPEGGEGARLKRFIAGGYNAGLYSYPSFVKLSVTGSDGSVQRCGATLISRQHLISATHCFLPAPHHSVLAESTIYHESPQGTVRLPVASVCHLDIESSDVSLLKLTKPVELSPTLQPACLPDRPLSDSLQMVALGLGATYIEDTETFPNITLPDELQALPVRRVPCSWDDRNWTHVCFQPYMEDYLGDTCKGDSGGGVFAAPKGRQTIYGVTSHGPDWTCREGQLGYSVNADVYNLKREIIKLIEEC